MQQLPEHLKKYIVEQDQTRYTAVDQAGWRYVMRQLRNFLKTRAHESYLSGLEKTGISTEHIPLIADISRSLEKFGWRALPVSGFIPPAAFMELQSLSILPIASDMRSLDHLEYTPAPDIVHEAAGHAPILVNPEFAAYLHSYAEVADKALMSRHDLDLYEAIRHLSDIKENPSSKESEIKAAQNRMDEVLREMSYISEAGLLSRLNWWTAEYGLIGDLENPKIYGAGLLSSVSESKRCLSSAVKKLPLTIDCIYQSYDITEPQPQLFVTPSFAQLSVVLKQMTQLMAYKIGGLEGLDRAIRAETVCTAELNSGLQISGLFQSRQSDASGQVQFLKTSGPTQLSLEGKQIKGQGVAQHADGFSSPLGTLQGHAKGLHEFSKEELKRAGIELGKSVQLKFYSGIQLEGQLTAITEHNARPVLFTFKNARMTGAQGEILFDPAWGVFDLALGTQIVSVFGRAADTRAFGQKDDFVAVRVPLPVYSDSSKIRQAHYGTIRRARLAGLKAKELSALCSETEHELEKQFPEEWLLRVEMLELLKPEDSEQAYLISSIRARLSEIAESDPRLQELIHAGLALVPA